MISVLLSAYNESSNPFFWRTLDTLRKLQDDGLKIEILIGMGLGHDDTLSQLERRNLKFFITPASNRAGRYNHAFEQVSCGKSDWIILNHPRSLLAPEAFKGLMSLSSRNKWGAYTHEFDVSHPVLDFTSWWSNHVRGDIKNIFYLDHCLFIRRDVFEKVGGVPPLEIFEDTVLSQNLTQICSPVRLPWKSTTSAVRFTRNGIWQQALKNQMLKIQFMMGKDHNKMNEEYERGLNLNCLSSVLEPSHQVISRDVASEKGEANF